MSSHGFELRFVGSDDEPAWVLVWRDADGEQQTAVDCDVERDGSWTRGDCMGELVHYLPADRQAQFTEVTKDLGYPADLAQVNAALARLGD